MQINNQTSKPSIYQTKSVDLNKIFFTLSAMALTFALQSATPSHAASFNGELKSVTITDSVGINTPPTAVIDYSIDGDVVNFDASGSFDSDGSLVSYSWDFGDGATGTGVSASHQFTGTYPSVTLTVIDNSGGVALAQVEIGTNAFADDFSTNTKNNYAVTHPWTKGGTGTFNYDAAGQRLKVNTGDDTGLQFSQSLPASSNGTFGLKYMPTKKYPAGGIVLVRLMQDQSNYYEIKYSDGYNLGIITKVVNGTEVENKQNGTQYAQNKTYNVEIKFSPSQVTVEGFGTAQTLSSDNSDIQVSSFEIELTQQDAYIDDIEYSNR
ncbi:MAG: PKD domain-containing protein [Desulforhopalus sp.]